jgi:hypothetical protein
MTRRKFVVASAISMVLVTVVIAGLAFYSDFAARAFAQRVPGAVHYLPADSQAVFGMSVQAFVNSPVYAKMMQQHEQEIGKDLAEFIARTGVDPRRDIDYVVAAARRSQEKDGGVVIAVGRFNPAAITGFIASKGSPIQLDYKGATVLMMPDPRGARLEKGLAFLSPSEIAMGDLESLHSVIDVRAGAPGIDGNAALSALLAKLNPQEMFWFAGDASSILSHAPANTPFGANLNTIQSVFGSLNITTTINGRITVAARDDVAAGQLADFARGLVALGNLMSGQDPNVAELVRGVQVTQRANEFDVTVTFPFELLDKLHAPKGRFGVDVPIGK